MRFCRSEVAHNVSWTRRRPGSRLSRSAARSNCCWATSQGSIDAARCSVVMMWDGPPCWPIPSGPARNSGSSPGRPHGAPIACRAVGASDVASEYRRAATFRLSAILRTATWPQPSRNDARMSATDTRTPRPTSRTGRGDPRQSYLISSGPPTTCRRSSGLSAALTSGRAIR